MFVTNKKGQNRAQYDNRMENGCRINVMGIVERKVLKVFEHFKVHCAYLAAMFVGRFTKLTVVILRG